MDGYIAGRKLGEGQYGDVFSYTHIESGEVVAIKKNRVFGKDGVSTNALREIKLLSEVSHPNVIGFRAAFIADQTVHLVLELMDGPNLEDVIRDLSIVLSAADVKGYLGMLLAGVHALHTVSILHRDLKPAQLLLSTSKPLKIADFGLSRIVCSPERHYTPLVVTLWYRAPELLFGARTYGPAIDMWAVGCILAEMLQRSALFQGRSELDQLTQIFSITGTPTEAIWPGVSLLPGFLAFDPSPPVPLESVFPAASADVLDLLAQLLTLNPAARISAADALAHRYFAAAPPPTAVGAFKFPARSVREPFVRNAPAQESRSDDDDDDDGGGERSVGSSGVGSARKRRRGGAAVDGGEAGTAGEGELDGASPSKRFRALVVGGGASDDSDGDGGGGTRARRAGGDGGDSGIPRRALQFD